MADRSTVYMVDPRSQSSQKMALWRHMTAAPDKAKQEEYRKELESRLLPPLRKERDTSDG